MRFQFCGGLDVPDWLLADIAILSKLSSVQLKLLGVAIMKKMLGATDFDYEKALQRTETLDGEAEVKSAIGAIFYVISNAARFNVDDKVLASELTQLGLPKESSDSLSRSYKTSRPKLVAHNMTQTLQYNTLSELKWRVDLVLSSSKCREINEPGISFQLEVKDAATQHTRQVPFACSLDKFRVLHKELRSIRDSMQ